MKRMVALILAAVLLLANVAFAVSNSTTIELSDMSLTITEGKKSSKVRFPNMKAEGAIGMSGQTPSVELTFISGSGQQIGAIMQMEGTQLLSCLGNISTVFSLDLAKITGDAGSAGLVAAAISSAISFGGLSLMGMIQAFTGEENNGTRVARMDIPTERFVASMNRALEKAEGLEAAERIDLEAIRAQLEALPETVQLEIRFAPSNSTFAVILSHDKSSLKLTGDIAFENAPYTYLDIDKTAERIDVTQLTEADIQAVNDEISLMAGQFLSYADAIGLDKFIPEK